MTDRMRESIFSALGDLTGTRILDLYAGSGSLGLEALSRGAEICTFVENARDAIVKLEENISACKMEDKAEVIWGEVGMAIGRPAVERVDLIFVDPPYSASPASVLSDLESLVTGGWLSDEGRVVLHRPGNERAPQPFGLQSIWDRKYGQSQVWVFAHEEEPD
jgi:16S rRNA (guanine966-N2)-methyltransferase